MKTSIAPATYALHGLAGVSELIRQRRLSPVDLVRPSHRIERLQPRLNAFITVMGDAARDAASVAESEIKAGRWRGPLHGIPVAVKDFYDTAEVKTTAAFERFVNRVPTKDADVVKKLKDAGAIVIGKTNMDALGMATTGLQSFYGPVKNPWNADYIAGGSSSGSAAAVASGMCYATVDTDAIGSCRLPAACCGVVGFKGTYGLISTDGILAGESPPDEMIVWFSHPGVTARRVSDTALVLDALKQLDALSQPVDFAREMNDSGRFRIGVATNFNADSQVASGFATAVDTIAGLGHVMTRVDVVFAGSEYGHPSHRARSEGCGSPDVRRHRRAAAADGDDHRSAYERGVASTSVVTSEHRVRELLRSASDQRPVRIRFERTANRSADRGSSVRRSGCPDTGAPVRTRSWLDQQAPRLVGGPALESTIVNRAGKVLAPIDLTSPAERPPEKTREIA